jgi:hypothetical protein
LISFPRGVRPQVIGFDVDLLYLVTKLPFVGDDMEELRCLLH